MIGKLTGLLDGVFEDHLVLDVNGVGYVVHCPARTLGRLPGLGEALSLSIETQLREDSLRLYGFESAAERDWFRLLQNVQGVGAKAALSVLSVLSAENLAQAVALGDKAQISRAPGIGPKLAARIAAELKDKAPLPAALDPAAARLVQSLDGASPAAAADAISALCNLGYARPQAATAVAASLAALGEGADAGALIRRSLKQLAG